MQNSYRSGTSKFESKADPKWLAVAAAGVTAIGAAQQSQAAVVYTPTSLVVDSTHSPGIDFDGDGTAEITARAGTNTLSLDKGNDPDKSSYLGDSGNTQVVAAVPYGESIGSSVDYAKAGKKTGYDSTAMQYTYNPSTLLDVTDPGNVVGHFTVAAGEQFIGVEFTLPDNSTHYGWIEFQTTDQTAGEMAGQIDGFAYESDPDTPIAAVPEPTSLALLALGAAGLAAYRGRRNR